ncbi:MAG: Crp/Fnr family transcriptional regulator [Oscillibacter sp.]|nr:Crp/Fnr family transcriptional regulator [Oscillibacter sp.]
MLFHGMTEPEILSALEALHGEEKAYQKGSVVLRAGETTDRMGMVLSGRVTVESTDVWGNRTILSLLNAGQFFGEVYALLPGEVLLVDMRVVEDCRILFLTLSGLEGHGEPWAAKLLRNLLGISAGQNLALSGRSFHTAPKTVRGRVMAYLNSVSLQRHSRAFAIPFDRQQMADYLNLDRTALSKELGKMREEGLIAFRKNRFEIL